MKTYLQRPEMEGLFWMLSGRLGMLWTLVVENQSPTFDMDYIREKLIDVPDELLGSVVKEGVELGLKLDEWQDKLTDVTGVEEQVEAIINGGQDGQKAA
jgi:hypothetical protein